MVEKKFRILQCCTAKLLKFTTPRYAVGLTAYAARLPSLVYSTVTQERVLYLYTRKFTGERRSSCNTKGAFRLDAKQREAKVGDLREWSITSLAKVANLRKSSRVVANLCDWSLHRLILTTYF